MVERLRALPVDTPAVLICDAAEFAAGEAAGRCERSRRASTPAEGTRASGLDRVRLRYATCSDPTAPAARSPVSTEFREAGAVHRRMSGRALCGEPDPASLSSRRWGGLQTCHRSTARFRIYRADVRRSVQQLPARTHQAAWCTNSLRKARKRSMSVKSRKVMSVDPLGSRTGASEIKRPSGLEMFPHSL